MTCAAHAKRRPAGIGPTDMASVEVSNVRKSFGGLEVIHGVSIRVEDGEFVILVGPSGCGKSTLLRMVAGLESVTSGELRIGERVVNDLLPKERDIAMVFQNYALYPQMTVAKNMSFSLELARRPTDEIVDKVNKAADILGLKPLLERYTRQLSGGQRQRVAMGRAIVRCFCSTSRSPILTRSCACRCAPRARPCSNDSLPRPSTSRTIRSRR